MKSLFNVPTTQMAIFVLFASVVVLFDGAFSLWVSLPGAIFPIFFTHDCLKNFPLEILDFLSPKLGINDHFTMAKDSICWCFGPRSCLNQVKFPFSA